METAVPAIQDVEIPHWECLQRAAAEVFKFSCGLELKVATTAPQVNADGAIVAVISLMGDVEWAVFLSMPRKAATGVAAKFAGLDIPFESDDMAEVIGGLTNIFAIKIKAALDKKSVRSEISLPNVLRCDSMETLLQQDFSIGKTCYETPLGALLVGLLKTN